MTFKYDLLFRPATPLVAPSPFAPAQVIQLLDGGGEAQQIVQLLVSEETGGGHLHLQTVGEVPQSADAVLHNLTHILQVITGNQCPPQDPKPAHEPPKPNRKSPTLHSAHF